MEGARARRARRKGDDREKRLISQPPPGKKNRNAMPRSVGRERRKKKKTTKKKKKKKKKNHPPRRRGGGEFERLVDRKKRNDVRCGYPRSHRRGRREPMAVAVLERREGVKLKKRRAAAIPVAALLSGGGEKKGTNSPTRFMIRRKEESGKRGDILCARGRGEGGPRGASLSSFVRKRKVKGTFSQLLSDPERKTLLFRREKKRTERKEKNCISLSKRRKAAADGREKR